ncbi:MAG: electron transport complex subunit A [Beggiatoa sp. IS2]|nr:MAG: electron transport complex subunit A [Beggiatoa sp. IS2]
MGHESLANIFVNACIVNNFVLVAFLGLCPFLGVSNKFSTAWNMGLATSFVLVVSSIFAYVVNLLLVQFEAEFLRLISYIVVIASSVQLVEMMLKKFSPVIFRALGIYLPLITTNCAVLGVALLQTTRNYDFIQSTVFSLGAGVGFSLALILMASLREQLALAEVPDVVNKGAILSLMLAGMLSLAFMGFGGLGAG